MSKKDYKSRVSKLRERRQGGTTYAFDSAAGAAPPIVESYEKRTPSESLKYALGAMQEVDRNYTRISHETGERVKRQLVGGFERKGEAVEIRLQGSLPLNIHVRRYSDVDLLVLPGSFLLYDTTGSFGGTYTPSARNRVDVVKQLRSDSYHILSNAFPEADVDNTGAKCLLCPAPRLRARWMSSRRYGMTPRDTSRRVLSRIAALKSWTYPVGF